MVELRPHQQKAVKQLSNGKVLVGGVGSGKTITSLAYYLETEAPKDIYVITTARKRESLEWEGDAAKLAIGQVEGESVAGILHVDSWNNIAKYTTIKDAFFIFDEQRIVGSGAWSKAFLRIVKNNRWVVLSATPGDTWLDYASLFIANGFYPNRSQFLERHAVFDRFSKFPKIKKWIEVERLEKYRNAILVEMPFERHTTRHTYNVPVDYDKDQYNRVAVDRWHIYEDRPLRDAAEMFAVMKRLVWSDISRLGELMKLYERHPRLIVFYNYDYELEILRGLVRTLDLPVAEWNGHRHIPVPDGDNWIYLVQYTAGAEAWNCITTNAIVFWSMNYSYKIWEQAKGRIDRMNTPYSDLHYYVMRSSSGLDNAVARALATKQSFNESKYYDKWGESDTIL